MLLSYAFNLDKEATAVEQAILHVLEQGYRTKDIHSEGTALVGTQEMGRLILQELGR